jgi:hypothetical protein
LTDTPQSERLRLLVDAGISLSSELSLDALLQRIVDAAAQLTAPATQRSAWSARPE